MWHSNVHRSKPVVKTIHYFTATDLLVCPWHSAPWLAPAHQSPTVYPSPWPGMDHTHHLCSLKVKHAWNSCMIVGIYHTGLCCLKHTEKTCLAEVCRNTQCRLSRAYIIKQLDDSRNITCRLASNNWITVVIKTNIYHAGINYLEQAEKLALFSKVQCAF